MNNLLRTLNNNPHFEGSPADLKGLFVGIREIKAQDPKSSDQFYEALEGVLSELKVVTTDNRDAEAFLKPVGRTDYPDYYEIVAHPMDLQTMLRKVKTRTYKNKLEFSDDLNLIWDNCFKYNSTSDHPLRSCATRLCTKANTLLSGITDRGERIQPHIPGSVIGPLPSPPSSVHLNGKTKSGLPNGKSIIKLKSKDGGSPFPSIKIPPQLSFTRLTSRPPSSQSILSSSQEAQLPLTPLTPSPIPLPERTALVRTPEAMGAFLDMDSQLDSLFDYSANLKASTSKVTLNDLQSREIPAVQNGNELQKLSQSISQRFRTLNDLRSDREREKAINGFRACLTTEDSQGAQNSPASLSRLSQDSGVKRKRSESLVSSDDQQRKRIKVKSEPSEAPRLSETPIPETADPLNAALDIWWKAVGTNPMIAAGVPGLMQPEKPPITTMPTKEKGIGTGKRKRSSDTSTKADVDHVRKKVKRKEPKEQKQTILNLMNSNISTLRRLRTSHNKYARHVTEKDSGSGEHGESQAVTTASAAAQSQGSADTSLTFDSEATTLVEEPLEQRRARERPWKVRGEMGDQEARESVHWMCGKVLEHSTFQGTSRLALESLCDITLAYISNIGNTLHLLMDKYSQRMSPEEIILHTLFENGVTSVSDLEYYIKDDIVRHGTRLQELEKKMNSALDEVIKAEVLDDDDVFGDEADEDNFTSGMFGDLLGEDYLGLEASGILSEFGSITIPKRLWKGKKTSADTSTSREKGEPPLPYPPPPPFVPLRSDQVDNQIGLLQDFYRHRFAALVHPSVGKESDPTSNPATTSIPAIAVLPPPLTSSTSPTPLSMAPTPSLLAPPGAHVPPTSLASGEEPSVLPDDTPDPAQTKIGPIGQIITPSITATTSSKKKSAKKDTPAGAAEQTEGSPSKAKGGGSKKATSKSQDKEGGKDQPPGGFTVPNRATTPTSKKKKTPAAAANGSGQAGNGTPSPAKKGSPAKPPKGNSSASKGPSNANGGGPVLIPPV